MKFSDYLQLNEEDLGSAEVNFSSNSTENIDRVDAPLQRINMPQLTKELMGDFVSDLTLHGIPFKSDIYKRYDELLPVQGELNKDKIKSIQTSLESDKKYKLDPILISDDNKIVDGNHRWAAQKNSKMIPVNQVGLSFEKLYDFLMDKPYVLRRKIDEHKD